MRASSNSYTVKEIQGIMHDDIKDIKANVHEISAKVNKIAETVGKHELLIASNAKEISTTKSIAINTSKGMLKIYGAFAIISFLASAIVVFLSRFLLK